MKKMKYLSLVFLLMLICSCINGEGNKTHIGKVLFNFIYRYEIIPSGKIDEIKFVTLIPKDYKDRQKIKNIKYSIKPFRIISDDTGKYAEFKLKNIDKKTEVVIECQVEIYKYDLNTARLLNAGRKSKALENPGEYLKNDEYIQSNDNAIISIAGQFNAGHRIELVKQIFDFVLSNMEYKLLDKKRLGALYGLNNKIGNCTVYSDLFVALCRAKGIPSRTVTGYSAVLGTDNGGHGWSEVYFDDLGWVPFDLSESDTDGTNSINFNNLEDRYFYLVFKKNNEFYEKYYKDLNYWQDGKVKYNFESGIYKML